MDQILSIVVIIIIIAIIYFVYSYEISKIQKKERFAPYASILVRDIKRSDAQFDDRSYLGNMTNTLFPGATKPRSTEADLSRTLLAPIIQ